MEEQGILVLRPIDMGEEPVPGAETIVAGCGHTCWIAPTSLKAMAEQPMETTCMLCMPSGINDVRLLPGVRNELAARWGPDQADAAMAEFEAFARQLKALWMN